MTDTTKPKRRRYAVRPVITIDDLVLHGACRRGLSIFRTLFPDGLPTTYSEARKALSRLPTEGFLVEPGSPWMSHDADHVVVCARWLHDRLCAPFLGHHHTATTLALAEEINGRILSRNEWNDAASWRLARRALTILLRDYYQKGDD